MTQTGLTLGTAAASEAGSGLAWSGPPNVLGYSTPRATVGFTKDNQQSNRLAVSGFGLAIPAGSAIVGIAVELAFLQNQGAAPGHIVSVILRDAAGDNSTLNFNGTTFATNGTLTFGGSRNRWQPLRPWTHASIVASTFAVAIAVGAAASGTTLQTLGIGSVRVNVWSDARRDARFASAPSTSVTPASAAGDRSWHEPMATLFRLAILATRLRRAVLARRPPRAIRAVLGDLGANLVGGIGTSAPRGTTGRHGSFPGLWREYPREQPRNATQFLSTCRSWQRDIR